MNDPKTLSAEQSGGSAGARGYAPTSETFTLLCCDDDELQAIHICTLAIERHIGHDPKAKHRVAEYIKNRYGA